MPNLGHLSSFIKKHLLWIFLILALGIGLIFVFSVPPWMHYDEPGHFEYAWLIANKPGLPQEGDFDQDMRRELVLSMIEHRFEDYTGVRMSPDPVGNEPIDILHTQTDDQPLYYFLISLPLRLAKGLSITKQLYVARLGSLAMYLLTIFIGYRVASDLSDRGHPLSWMLPTFLVTLPGFVDIMTAVNNDVGAIAAFSLFVWVSVCILIKGINLRHLFFLIISVLFCFFTKSTAWVALPLAPLVIFMGLFKWKHYKLGWAGILIFLMIGLAFTFSWDQSVPAYYFLLGDQAELLRIKEETAPVGEYVLQQTETFYHTITPQSQEKLAGQTATFGAYIWADQPCKLQFPIINRLDLPAVEFETVQIELTSEPTFYASQVILPEGNYLSWLKFPDSRATNLYWDGLVFVSGDFDAAQAPQFSSSTAETGTWQGKPFTNLLRNGSGEKAWPLFSSPARRFIRATNNWFSTSQILTLLDYESNAWYYRVISNYLLRTFWGQFGWGAVPLVGSQVHLILRIMTYLMLIGAVLGVIIHRKHLNWRVILFFTISTAAAILITVLRGSGSWFGYRYYPTARYFYPAIIPIGSILTWGLFNLFQGIMTKVLPFKWTKPVSSAINIVFIGCCILLIIWGIGSILQYYA